MRQGVSKMGFLIDDDDEEYGTLVAENAQWRLWVNDMTEIYERELNEYNTDGFTLQGKYKVVLAENKITGDRSYLMMDKATQEPVADWTDPTSFSFKKALILMDLKDDCNVVNMAKANKKKKRKVKK